MTTFNNKIDNLINEISFVIHEAPFRFFIGGMGWVTDQHVAMAEIRCMKMGFVQVQLGELHEWVEVGDIDPERAGLYTRITNRFVEQATGFA
jgi:hypothetical protein